MWCRAVGIPWHSLAKAHFKVWLDLFSPLIGVSRLHAGSILCPGHLRHYRVVRILGTQTWGLFLFSSGRECFCLTQKMCLLAPRDTWSSQLPSAWQWNQCASLLQDMSLWSEWSLSGGFGRGDQVLGLFIVQMGPVSTIRLIILFMPGVTMTPTNQLYRASLV